MFSLTDNNSMKSLLDKLIIKDVIKSDKVYNALLKVDRADFINPLYAYQDR